MILHLPEGPVLIEAHHADHALLVVRAAEARILAALFPDVSQMVRQDARRGYPFRLFVRRRTFGKWIAHRIEAIGYESFEATRTGTRLDRGEIPAQDSAP